MLNNQVGGLQPPLLIAEESLIKYNITKMEYLQKSTDLEGIPIDILILENNTQLINTEYYDLQHTKIGILNSLGLSAQLKQIQPLDDPV